MSLLLAVVPALLAAACSGPTSPSSTGPLFRDAPHDPAACPAERTIRCRTVTANFGLLDASLKTGPGSVVGFNLFEDAVFDAALTTGGDGSEGGLPDLLHWLGEIARYEQETRYEQGTISLVFTRDHTRLSGSVRSPLTYPKNYFLISDIPGRPGLHLIREYDPRSPTLVD